MTQSGESGNTHDWHDVADAIIAASESVVGRCPACDGCGGFLVDSMTLYGVPGGFDWGERCPDCKGSGEVTLLRPLTDEERNPDALRERAMRRFREGSCQPCAAVGRRVDHGECPF